MLRNLNDELTAAFWLRYNELQAKIASETTTKPEQEELTALVERSEEWNIRRLRLLQEMAVRRGTNFVDLIARLKITRHPLATVGL